MTSRIGQPDTEADRELRASLGQQLVPNFIMVAGAGSGKTTSLVKALDHLSKTKGDLLRNRRQRIACITYTEVAVGEITTDVGKIPLFHISTIHSFLWTLVSPFQADIRVWVVARIEGKIADANEKIAKPRTQERTRVKLRAEIARHDRQRAAIAGVPGFKYGTGSDYANGILGHEDILRIGPELIAAKPLLRSLIASRFPYIFVDESQDTNPNFVTALREIEATAGVTLCLGFFGDPMQKIYATGVGKIEEGNGWKQITKPENFRCPTQVLKVVNNVRAEDDGLEQTRGRTILVDGVEEHVEGTARLFVLPADAQRTERLIQVRRWLAEKNDDPLWLQDQDDADVRMLVLVHRMAARRLGFPNIYAALSDDAPSSLKGGLTDGTTWVLRPFLTYLLPLVMAARANEAFDVIAFLRQHCPLLYRENLLGQDVAVLLARLDAAVQRLTAMLADNSTSTIKDVVAYIREQQLISLDQRLVAHLDGAAAEVEADDDNSADVALAAFLECRATELWGYRTYVEGQSPFATQQGIKGAEFDRVLVVLDDEESDHPFFSYGKYFGFTALSNKDQENIADGKESILDRTRRLFYVCCSRACKDLAVVLFAPDVAAAKRAVLAKGFFPAVQVFDAADLAA